MPQTSVMTTRAPVCRICATALGARVVQCPSCHSPYHADCWTYIGGCAIYGCTVAHREWAVVPSRGRTSVALGMAAEVARGGTNLSSWAMILPVLMIRTVSNLLGWSSLLTLGFVQTCMGVAMAVIALVPDGAGYNPTFAEAIRHTAVGGALIWGAHAMADGEW